MDNIQRLSEIPADKRENILKAVEEIFFLSSSIKEFSSIERKEAFYKKWCKDYQSIYPEEFFIVSQGDKVLGYLSGCSDSILSLETLQVPGLRVFSDLFAEFPAHLHINFHPDARGKGLGSILIRHYIAYLQERKVRGLHLITSPEALNVSFYERLGFNQIFVRKLNNSSLQFMGILLESTP